MATFKFLLRKQKQRENGKIPIYLRITENRKPRFISTGITIKEKYWNTNNQRVRGTHNSYKVFNDKLDQLEADARVKANKAKSEGRSSAQTIKQKIKGVDSPNFIDYTRELLPTFGYWKKRKYKVLINKLESFHGPDLRFNDIDTRFLRKFELWLEEVKENAQNTRSKELGKIRAVLNTAMRDRIVKPDDNPFLLGYKLKWEKPDVTKMDWEEVKDFKNVELEPWSLKWTYQQAFLFAMYNDGMRFQDVCNCRWDYIHEGTLKYRMLKNNKVKVLQLPNPSIKILEKLREKPNGKFVFPILEANVEYDKITIREAIDSANKVANEQLKKIALEAELRPHLQKHLTTHVAVHTFTHLADEQGWSLTEIQEARKHSNIQTTRDYIGRINGDRLTKKRGELFQ